ncbi:MAG: hypothetical protein L6365_04400 [Desulfobulbaceae bacterium]|nr:hypothetical protein [Pseudomonadota bacterium]MCG2746756.1 hypothetical protein [Desulfobulbaceae bacterium]
MSGGRWFLLQSGLFFATVIVLLLLCSQRVHRAEKDQLPARLQLVRTLKLTDFALWSEARYTRHPSQADWFAPFQDFPSSFEHFPAGSLMGPLLARPATRIEFHRQPSGIKP